MSLLGTWPYMHAFLLTWVFTSRQHLKLEGWAIIIMISASYMLTYIAVGERWWKLYQSPWVWKKSKLFQKKKKKKPVCEEQSNWNNVHLQLHSELEDTVITRPLHLLSGSKPGKFSSCVIKAITSWWWGCVNEHVKETSQPFIIFFPKFLYISV